MLLHQQYITDNTLDKLLLIIAEFSSENTFMLTERIANLLINHNVQPEQIIIFTSNEKTAKELLIRISHTIMQTRIKINVSDFYLGTSSTIFLKLIDKYLEYSMFNKNYVVLDHSSQKLFIYRQLNSFFSEIKGLKEVVRGKSEWDIAQYFMVVFNNFTAENLDICLLKLSENRELSLLAYAYELYITFMQKKNCIDFKLIQKEFHRILCDNPEVLEKIQNQVDYLLIDEHQNTNTLQELILLKLTSKHKKIYIVENDDQSFHRPQGVTVKNILEFEKNF